MVRMDLGLPYVHVDFSMSSYLYGEYTLKDSWYKWNAGVEIPLAKRIQIIPKVGMLTKSQYAHNAHNYFSYGIDFVYLSNVLIYFDAGLIGVANNGYKPGITFSVGLYLPKFNY